MPADQATVAYLDERVLGGEHVLGLQDRYQVDRAPAKLRLGDVEGLGTL